MGRRKLPPGEALGKPRSVRLTPKQESALESLGPRDFGPWVREAIDEKLARSASSKA